MNKKRVWRVTAVFTIVIGFMISLQFWLTTQALESQTTQAGTPSQISYQGYLVDEAGQPINGSVALQFNIFAEAAGGTSFWQENHASVPVNDGYFTVYLGSVTPLTAAVFNQPTRYLQVSVDTGDGLLTLPRQQFAAVPYALQADAAAQVPWSGITNLPPNLANGEVWTMNGNGGTNPNAHFLGTTDAVSLTLAVSGTTALRLEPAVNFNGEPAPNVILGAESNRISNSQNNPYANVIGGGTNNTVSGAAATVSGGSGNTARDNHATVSGGYANTASSDVATVSGGSGNTASGSDATVSGGFKNTASGSAATVSGGYNNIASGIASTIGGGIGNRVNGSYATISGGYDNAASGNYSFAAGNNANAAHNGTFVWADNQTADYISTAENQFAIRASGGVTLAVNAGEDKPIQVGERYRDNGIIAWARVSAGGVLDEGFGISEVIITGPGSYAITVDGETAVSNGASLIPMAIAEIDSVPASASSVRFVSINQTGSQTFNVYINNGNFLPVPNDFVFMVTGR